jgi:hypothetical protein
MLITLHEALTPVTSQLVTGIPMSVDKPCYIATCNIACRSPGIGLAIKNERGKKLIFLNSTREAGSQTHLVLRDAAITYITAYSQVIFTKKVKTKITPINSYR